MESIYQQMREFLKNRGINANEAGNGRLLFSVNGLNFIFDASDKDPHFMRLTLPQINRKGIQVDNLNQQIHQLNQNYKVAKIVRVPDGTLWIFADAFVYNEDNSEALFVRLIQALTDMINEYRTIENNGNGTTQAQ